MERQTSNLSTTNKSPSNPPAPSAASPPSTPANTTRRKRARNGGSLFVILRVMAFVGPLGFVANIIYFQYSYFHGSTHHSKFSQFHPMHGVSEGIQDRYDHHRQMTGKDDVLSEPQSHAQHDNNNNMHNNMPTVLSGTAVLKRLQKQATFSWKACGSSSQATLDLAKQLNGNRAQDPQHGQLRATNNQQLLQLEPFALKDALSLGRKLRESNTTARGLNMNQCQIPQRGSLECSVSTYSIILTFQGVHNFRPLFMNLITFLTYPSVSDIVVLMPHHDWGFEGQSIMDVKYKERLKAWHNDKQHKVTMIGLPEQLQPPQQQNSKASANNDNRFSVDTIVAKVMAKLTSKAILFVDGNTLWSGNVRGIEAGLELWKQNPHALVATHNNRHNTEPINLDCQASDNHGGQHPWAPFCQKPRQQSNVPSDIRTLHQQYQHVLDMNGVFVHRDMLCLLQQPLLLKIMVQSVWRVLDDATNPQATLVLVRSILATTLLQISSSPPLLFPSSIARPTNETRDYNDNWHYLPSDKETEHLKMDIAINTKHQQRVLMEVLSYFGMGLSADVQPEMLPYWCSSHKTVDDVFYLSEIAWMEGGPDGKC